MKKLLLLVSLLFVPIVPVPVRAQQTNIFETCTQYREHYVPGGTDGYGNYFPGRVRTERYSSDCVTPPNLIPEYRHPGYYNEYPRRHQYPRNYYRYSRRTHGYYYCNPNNAVFGALLGGSVGRALTSTRNNRRNRGWATGLGAAIGGLVYSC